MKAEIMAVGTEILLGDILNTNARYLSRELALLGIGVYYQTVVGDNEERLLNAFKLAFERADMVITTGGLGPTDDDITKETGGKFFNLKMVENEEAVKNVKDYFKGKEMPKSNKKQGFVPEGATVFYNHNGTAPGCMIEKNGKILIMLPGPPYETEPMFEEYVLPFLKKKSGFTIISKVLHLSGIGESAAAEVLSDIMSESENPTIAPYAKPNEMIFRVSGRGESEEEAKNIIKPVVEEIYGRLGKYIYGEDGCTLEEAVIKELVKRNLTLASAESCTGGLIAGKIVDYPGASEVFLDGVVSYSNESKVKRLGVSQETLDKYGAVSEETAREMAEGVIKAMDADVGVSSTGVAGPGGGTDEKPVGLIYVAVSIKGKTTVKKLNLKGGRNKIRNRVVTEALTLLLSELKGISE
ncbi:MAG: competence/damage-inducible protein A [Clostridiales bacterium]|nr:competence/damage-inducible protein A [Clostridiales bacterium]